MPSGACARRSPGPGSGGPDTRTWKNSSRLEAKIAQELHPLEQGVAGVTRLVEHPCVELDPRQLAVEDRALAGRARGDGARGRRLGVRVRVERWPWILTRWPGTRARRVTTPRPRFPAGRREYHPAAGPRPAPPRKGACDPAPIRRRGRTAARPTMGRSRPASRRRRRVDEPLVGGPERRPSGRWVSPPPARGLAGLLRVERAVPGPLDARPRSSPRPGRQEQRATRGSPPGPPVAATARPPRTSSTPSPPTRTSADDHPHRATQRRGTPGAGGGVVGASPNSERSRRPCRRRRSRTSSRPAPTSRSGTR